jgi:hypothetical protein
VAAQGSTDIPGNVEPHLVTPIHIYTHTTQIVVHPICTSLYIALPPCPTRPDHSNPMTLTLKLLPSHSSDPTPKEALTL